MKQLKSFIKRLFQPYESQDQDRGLIWCSDCGKMDYIHFPNRRTTYSTLKLLTEYQLPHKWRMVEVGLQFHFLCPDCIEKRREFGLQLLKGARENDCK